MDRAARRFARWVLILHAALFVVVLLIIGFTLRVLYNGARTQAIDQARQTQELLAKQTALGLQNYYDSITGVLELLQPTEAEPSPPEERRASPAPARRERMIRQIVEEGPFARVAPRIWPSLSERISLLFIADAHDSQVRVVKVLGSDPDAPPADRVLDEVREWLPRAQRASVSAYMPLDAGGSHVIAVPMRAPRGLFMIALVPIAKIDKNLLASVNARATTGAMLVDESATIVSSQHPDALGANMLTDVSDPHIRHVAERYLKVGAAGTELFEKSEKIGEAWTDPSMSTIQPAEILGQRWWVVISSSLRDIDNVVKPIFRDAMIWGGFIMLAMTAILTSTSIQMIRSRIRMERIRHDLINRELAQARQIQLAWLPHNDDDPPWVDLSAVNRPATQISGDFYNWFQHCDGRTVVVIGDVTGHGMAAAFLMATTQLLVRTTMPRVSTPGECLEEVNRQLCQNAFHGQFVTMLILTIDVHSGVIQAATAGHPPPLVGQGDRFEAMEIEPQLVLGVDPDTRFETQRFQLSRGSAIVLYTDGVVDALNPSQERFSVSKLTSALYGRYEHAQALTQAVLDAVDLFRAGEELPDDLTLVAIQLQEAPVHREPASAHHTAARNS